jgi:hypothetical protein
LNTEPPFIHADNLDGDRRCWWWQNRYAAAIVASILAYFLIVGVTWSGWSEIQSLSATTGVKEWSNALLDMAVSFSFVHYYLDGKFWKFSDQEVRTMLVNKLGYIRT